MKIKGKQHVEYWITRTREGKLIRVYRIDGYEGAPFDKPQNAFDVPIMVECTGMAEGIADILEEREKLKTSVEYFERQLLEERRRVADRDRYTAKKKKWYKFWIR